VNARPRHPYRAVLYLFDGYNILHAGSFGSEGDLVDTLAGFVALEGAQGVVVFDGAGETARFGPLEVRYAAHADDVLERLAAEHRGSQRVRIVSSDRAVRRTAGQEVSHASATQFLRELAETKPPKHEGGPPRSQIADALDEKTRERLEAWRRRRR
jgi:predicted RNA-binding protein with PIN domain